MAPRLVLLLLLAGRTSAQLGCTTQEDLLANFRWVREACEQGGEAFADLETLVPSAVISTTHFPVWGGNLDSVPADLSLGSNNDRGTTPECNGQGHAYMGSQFQICGDFDQQGDHLHTAVVHHNDWEVWRLADAK